MDADLGSETVLVTGGAGYIGGQTVLCLLDAGYRVCVLDDLSTGQRRPFHEDTVFYEGRIHDQALVHDIVRQHNVTSVLHFAGSIQVAESVDNPLKYYDNNMEGSRLLVEAAVGAGVRSFVFSSTAAIYGAVESGKKVAEDSLPAPLNPYGWSKLFTEKLLEDVSQSTDLNYGILRYFNVAGADPRGRHGQFLENPVHLIGRSIDAMRGKGGQLKIFGSDLPTSDGTGVRDYIHVSDLADAHIATLGYLKQHKKNTLFNLGYGMGHSVMEVIRCIEKLSGNAVPHKFVEARPGEAPEVVADVKKVTAELDWKPQHNDLNAIVSSALQWGEVLESNRSSSEVML